MYSPEGTLPDFEKDHDQETDPLQQILEKYRYPLLGMYQEWEQRVLSLKDEIETWWMGDKH